MALLVILASAVALLCLQSASADTIVLTGTVRDIWPCPNASYAYQCGTNGLKNPFKCDYSKCMHNFEENNIGDKNMVATQLGNDSKPVLLPGNHPSLTDGGANWQKWYNTFEGWNIPVTINLTLDNTVCEDGVSCTGFVYGYTNAQFFPVDNLGFGNYYPVNNVPHNFGFTFELHSRFTYFGNEEFKFTGDDDVWVFINNQLVVDLGGVHGAESASVILNQTNLGLVKGHTYPFDIFFNERHTSASHFMMYTSIALYCPYMDWCGVCNGDGQSCCNCTNDDKCSTVKCDTFTGACKSTPISCDHSNQCLNNTCNPATGTCQAVSINCDDGNVCTSDQCLPSSGCSHQTLPCDDSNECTTDYCDPTGGCTFTNITCNDQSACTKDTCNPDSGCMYTQISCDDQSVCTTDTCIPATGCAHTPIPCDKCEPTSPGTKAVNCSAPEYGNWNACFPLACDPADGECKSAQPFICNDGNNCTIDRCIIMANGSAGCSFTPRSCDLSDLCNPYFCDASNGQCALRKVMCDDHNVCTNDTCHLGNCSYTSVDCNDHNACTVDACLADKGGCVHSNVTCDDSNACTDNLCNTTTGCNYPDTVFPDPSACNTQYCDQTIGLVVSPVKCQHSCTCDTDSNECSCPQPFYETTAAKISGGVIAAIAVSGAVGAVAFAIGGKKGYDYFKSSRAALGPVSTSPLYEAPQQDNHNPFYTDDAAL